jgi:hypothetical protein
VPSFTFWSPTALSNCGHFLYGLGHIDAERAKAVANRVEDFPSQGLVFTFALHFDSSN